MYSFKNIFTKTPIQLSTALGSIINVLVLTKAIDWSVETLAGINIMSLLVFGLFVASQTANKAVLNEIATAVEEATPAKRTRK